MEELAKWSALALEAVRELEPRAGVEEELHADAAGTGG